MDNDNENIGNKEIFNRNRKIVIGSIVIGKSLDITKLLEFLFGMNFDEFLLNLVLLEKGSSFSCFYKGIPEL